VVWTSASGGMVRHGFAFPAPKGPDFAAALHAAESR
jgi:hypothetical protein